jgi:hypothetical protein
VGVVRALTLTQPWATLVILGIKRWETRGWFPSPAARSGRIVIHAAKGWKADDRAFARELHDRGILPVTPEELPLGAGLGTVRLDGLARTPTALTFADVTELEQELGDYSPGRYAWQLGDPRPFPEPVPVRGMLGLWEWPA